MNDFNKERFTLMEDVILDNSIQPIELLKILVAYHGMDLINDDYFFEYLTIEGYAVRGLSNPE